MLASFSNSNFYNQIYKMEGDDTNHEDIIFNEPQSLLSILKKYHSDTTTYRTLLHLVKPNEMPIMLFDSLRQFGYKDECEIKIEYFGKIYLKSWNLDPTYLNYVGDIVNNKYQAKCNQNKKAWWAAFKKADPWDNEPYPKSRKRHDLSMTIAEGVEEYDNQMQE